MSFKSVFICFSLVLVLTPASWAAPFRLIIDPGHGGVDQGAVYGKAKESVITLQVAQALMDLLKKDDRFRATLTRSKDLNLSLPERVKMAEKNHADLFLSLHANASTDFRARGAEFFFQNHLPPDEETLFLAAKENQALRNTANTDAAASDNDVQVILQDLKQSSKMAQSHILSLELLSAWKSEKNTGSNPIRQAPFHVIAKTEIPSVLVELGYLSNPKEGEQLVNPKKQKEMAEKIYQGLVRYKEKVDSASPARLQ